jgi:capsular exopolysaccharide synthesis family protein
VNGEIDWPAGEPPGLPALPIERTPADPRYAPLPDAESVHLRDYWDVLLRHRWTALAFLTAVVASTLLVTLFTVPIYKAMTLIEIRAQGQKVLAFQDIMQMSQVEREFYQTQYDVLRSRSLAKRVLERLRLADDPTFNPPSTGPGPVGTVIGWVTRPFASAGSAEPMDAATVAEHQLITRFLSAVDVTPRRNSYLVEVSFLSPSPRLAADVANALAEEYVSLSLDQRLDAVQRGRAFIERQLGVTKAALEHSEEDLQAFARANEILTVDTKQSIEARKLADLNEALTRAQSDRMAKQSLYEQVAKGDTTTLSQVANNPVLTNLLGLLAKAESSRALLGETFTDEYPKLRRLKGQIVSLNERIRAERKAIATSMRADFEAAKKQEALLTQALNEQKKMVSDLNQRSIDYKILKREVDTNRGIYNSLLQRLKEVEVSEGMKASNIHVLDVAEVPIGPHRPRPFVNLVLALVVGVVGGVGLVFVQEHFDNSLKTPDDIERYLRVPLLGALPELRLRRLNGKTTDIAPELIVAEEPKSAGAEALRTLRASLFLSTAAGPPQRLLVTSARPQEGKTCVTTNLALVLAQMGKRVVVVDCDLRRPRIHRVFGLALDLGATNFLTGNMDLPSLIHRTPHGIDVLPSGPLPPNPVELIDSAPMASLLEELSRRYDFVLLDAPPALGFADVPLLARLAGGVLFVVRAGVTPRTAAGAAIEHLLRLRARLLGVVLNGVRNNSPGYYSSYYSYYGYRSDEDDEGTAEQPLLEGGASA